MATPAQRTNTWILNEWYDQAVAGTTGGYNGEKNLMLWGRNESGYLGQNQPEASMKSSPVQVPGQWKLLGENYKSTHTQAIKTDGTLWSWGANYYGEFGDNTNEGSNADKYSSPVQCGTDTTWAVVVPLAYASLATKTDGTLWSWGRNQHGMLGQDNLTEISSPAQVGSDTTWPIVQSKCSGNTNGGGLMIKTDGSLWTWGANNQGKLGLSQPGAPTGGRISSPAQIGTGTDWGSVSTTSFYFSTAVKTDGTLWQWGQNKYGQLGQNESGAASDNMNYSSPCQVPGTTWSRASSAAQSTLATKTDGSLWGWGRNYNGHLGHNNEVLYSSPVQVGTDTDWDLPFCGNSNAVVLKTDGSYWAIGANEHGELGQNQGPAQLGGRSSPVQVGTRTDWIYASVFGEDRASAGLLNI